MHQLREAAFAGIVGVLSLVAACGLGCSSELQDAATEVGAISNRQVPDEIRLVSEASAIEAAPNVLHEVQLAIKNVGKQNLQGVSPKLPCRCNIVQPLPTVLLAGSTHTVTMRVLTLFAGSLIKDIELFNEDEIWVGSLKIAFQVLGDVPRLAQSVKPVWF